MTKDNLLIIIEKAISLGNEKAYEELKRPFLYKKAVTQLENIRQEVIQNIPPQTPYNSATSLGVFAVKEVDLYDKDYSLTLCKVSRAYEEYHGIKR